MNVFVNVNFECYLCICHGMQFCLAIEVAFQLFKALADSKTYVDIESCNLELFWVSVWIL